MQGPINITFFFFLHTTLRMEMGVRLSSREKRQRRIFMRQFITDVWSHQQIIDIELRPEPWQKNVAKFNCNTESIVHKKYVPPGYVVNVKFYCNWLLNNRHIRPENWRNDSWAQIHDKAKAPASLVVQHFLVSTNTTVIPHFPSSPDNAHCDFSYSRRWNLSSKWNVLTAL